MVHLQRKLLEKIAKYQRFRAVAFAIFDIVWQVFAGIGALRVFGC